jgi:hypothetical protein
VRLILRQYLPISRPHNTNAKHNCNTTSVLYAANSSPEKENDTINHGLLIIINTKNVERTAPSIKSSSRLTLT